MRAAARRLRAGLTMLTGTAAGASAVLAVLVIASVFVAVALPRASVSFRTRALRQVVAATPPTGRAIVASTDFTTLASALAIAPGPSSPGIGVDEMVAVAGELAASLRALRIPLQPVSHRWWGLTSGYAAVPDASRHAYFGATPPQLEVLYRTNLGRNARLVVGTTPATVSADSGRPVFQVAVTQATAARFMLHVGSVLTFPGQATFAVSGIIRPVRRDRRSGPSIPTRPARPSTRAGPPPSGSALAALVSVPLFALRQVPSAGLADERSDSQPTRQGRARRAVADLTLALAAAGGVAVLRQESAARPSGTDWYTSAAPALVAIPVAIVAVRLYPIAVRWLVRLSGRRQGVTTFVGLARAARASLAAVLPAFALVLVLAVIAFGATLRAAVVRGDVAESWRATGADVVIDTYRSTVPIDGAVRRAIAAVPGVQRTSTLSLLPGVAADGTPVTVVVVDPASYAALIAATPQPSFPAAALTGPGAAGGPGPVPVLASPSARHLVTGGRKVLAGYHDFPVRVTGTVRDVPGSSATGAFIVAPARAMVRTVGASEAQPSRLLVVGPGVDAARMRSVVGRQLPAATLAFRAGRLASLTEAPLPHGTYTAFAEGAAAAALYGAVVVLIMLALGARSRELTLARLFTMGLSPGQARRLVITEALPAIIAAAAGGAVCARLLVPLVGPAIDLSPLTGSTAPVPVRADYALVGLLAAGLLALAIATLLAQSAATRLRGVSRALRVGE